MNFIDYLENSIENRKSLLCAGFDLRPADIPECYHDRSDDIETRTEKTLRNYYTAALQTIEPHIACIKPNIAFFEQYGIGALKALRAICEEAQRLQVPVILDGKRGDIGSTNVAYANAFLRNSHRDGDVSKSYDTSQPFPLQTFCDVDALTVNPFLGLESTEPFIETARANGKGLFLLVRTSNPDAGFLQDAKSSSGRSISECVADWIRSQEESLRGACGVSALGAVVGATAPEEARRLRELMPTSLFLVPGYGAQGAGAQEALAGAIPGTGMKGRGVIVNSSRGIFSFHEESLPREESDFLDRLVKRASLAQRELTLV